MSTRSSIVLVAVLLSCAVVGACPAAPPDDGDEGEGEQGDEGEGEGEGELDIPDAPEPLPAALVAAIEAAAATCAERDVGLFAAAVDPLFLEDARAAIVAASVPPLQNAVDDGLVVIDDDAVAACIVDLAEPVCLQGRIGELIVDTCSRIARGLVADGGACDVDAQCAGGNCSEAACACAGPDVRPPLFDVDSLACTREEDCPLGETCLAALDVREPLRGDCVPTCGSGDDCAADELCDPVVFACVPNGEGAPCSIEGECPSALFCVNGVCRAPAGLGEQCTLTRCGGGLSCVDGTCAELPGLGEPCTSPERLCDQRLQCELPSGTCVAGPGVGEPCDGTVGADGCGPGAVCSFGEEPTCVAPTPLGGPCTTDSRCATGACDETRGRCVLAEPAVEGDDCALASCASPLRCVDDVCVARGAGRVLGDACTPAFERVCPLGLTCDESATCQPIVVVEEGACSLDVRTGPVCAGSASVRRCEVPFDAQTGTCTDVPGVGGDCDDGRCTRDAYCGVESGQCTARREEGGPCDEIGSARECVDGLVCAESTTCEPPERVTGGFDDDLCSE